MKMHLIAMAVLVVSSSVAPAHAQTTYKCTDSSGEITYSGKQCSSLGLKEIGEVRDRLSVVPGSAPAARGAPTARASAQSRGAGRNSNRDGNEAASPTTQAPPAIVVPAPTARR
jgi:hypothetical protein